MHVCVYLIGSEVNFHMKILQAYKFLFCMFHSQDLKLKRESNCKCNLSYLFCFWWQIVNLIEETGHFHITNTTFDFDLCSLDKTTVRKLQSYLETSGASWGQAPGCVKHCALFFKKRRNKNIQNDATKMAKNQLSSALFFVKASHHLLIKERKITSLRGLLFSPRKCSGRVSLDSLEKKTLNECVWYHVSLSVVFQATRWMHVQHTALLHNWSIYYYIRIFESPWENNTTRRYKSASPMYAPSMQNYRLHKPSDFSLVSTPLCSWPFVIHLQTLPSCLNFCTERR